MNDPLARYGCRDEMGHPLRNIVEYRQMCEIVDAARQVLKMRDMGSRAAVMAATQVLVEATERFNAGQDQITVRHIEGGD